KKKEGGGDSKGGAVGKAKPVKDGDASLRERSARKTLMRGIEKLVKQCVEQRFPAQAYEILLWAIDLDPDNEGLRKLVRQYKYEKGSKVEWYSPFDLAKVNQGYKQHPEYGWVTDAELKALKSGMLWFKSKWHPREKVESERQKWENRWTYETEHFLIDTNADLSDAVAFGREVERLYAFFFRIFIDFYSNGNAGEDAKLVFGGGKELGKQKLRLHYYRSREHFLSEIAKDPECNKFPNPPGKDPLIAQSAGFYWGATHKAYFFRGPNGPDLSVIYHEVTHQVFGETYPSSGRNPPTWLVEGFGVFMEDPIVRGERLLAGAEPPPGIRKSDVRDINDFVKNYQNHNEFHGGKRGNNYATAGAVVHFFLYYKGGLYRQGFMQYAREGYRNNTDNEPTHIKKLYEYLKISEEQLQTDWEAFNADPDLFDF
ncbi:MAG: hypothetical protein HY721_08515, partial [Planctomycetes bacterium]|nr:hypothetical protein [Planctomycetota bacterium]